MSNATPLLLAGLLAGVAGVAAGGFALYSALSAGQAADAERHRLQDEQLEALGQSSRELTQGQRELGQRVERTRADLRERDARIAELERQLAERNAAGPAPPAVEPASTDGSKIDEAAAGAAEFADLQAKVFGGKATPDEMARFWELARTSGALNDMLGKLEGKVKGSPGDLKARMQLAQGYVAKLLTVPDGPERGAWAMKAEGQWAKVLAVDENHWDAGYSLGVSWSQWPDFFNKTPDALKQFETLRDVQERGHPEARHAQTYLSLSRLHRKLGNADKAREALEAGAARHPESEDLRKALDALGD